MERLTPGPTITAAPTFGRPSFESFRPPITFNHSLIYEGYSLLISGASGGSFRPPGFSAPALNESFAFSPRTPILKPESPRINSQISFPAIEFRSSERLASIATHPAPAVIEIPPMSDFAVLETRSEIKQMVIEKATDQPKVVEAPEQRELRLVEEVRNKFALAGVEPKLVAKIVKSTLEEKGLASEPQAEVASGIDTEGEQARKVEEITQTIEATKTRKPQIVTRKEKEVRQEEVNQNRIREFIKAYYKALVESGDGLVSLKDIAKFMPEEFDELRSQILFLRPSQLDGSYQEILKRFTEDDEKKQPYIVFLTGADIIKENTAVKVVDEDQYQDGKKATKQEVQRVTNEYALRIWYERKSKLVT